MWEYGFQIGSKFNSNALLDANMYRFGTPSVDKLDAKSPYFKFGLPSNVMNFMQTPNKQPIMQGEPKFFSGVFQPTTPGKMFTPYPKPNDAMFASTPGCFKFNIDEIARPLTKSDSSPPPMNSTNVQSIQIAPIVEIEKRLDPYPISKPEPKLMVKREIPLKPEIKRDVEEVPPITQHQKAKKQTKKSKRKNLSSREDVMNKNIFRAIKRQLKIMFTEYLESPDYKSKDTSYKSDEYMLQVEQFGQYLISKTEYDRSEFPVNIKDYDMYLAIMIDYCRMKKVCFV